MENTRPIWRSLRPVLLAAAAATSWLALSAPAATADATAEPAPLIKSASSSLVATTTQAADHTASLLVQQNTEQPPPHSRADPIIALPAALPMLSPTVSDVTASADGLLHSAAAVTSLSAADPGAILTDPTVPLAGTVTGDASAAVLPVTGTVNETLDAVVQPIIDHAVRPVGSPIPGTGAALPEVLIGGTTGPVGLPSAIPPGAREETAPSSPNMLVDVTLESSRTGFSSTSAIGAAVTSGNRGPFQPPAAVAGSAAPGFPAGRGLDALFYPVPAMPGSGAAGSVNSGGSPSVPAWLTNHDFMIPSHPASRVGGAALRVPTPVSFEPGSSPD